MPAQRRPSRPTGQVAVATLPQVREALANAGVGRLTSIGVCLTPGLLALAYDGAAWLVETPEPERSVEELERDLAPRWVWWSSHEEATGLVAAGVRLAACWDLAAAHRLIAGGWADDPARVWALANDLPESGIPESGQLDLLSLGGEPAPSGEAGGPGLSAGNDPDDPDDPDDPVGADGYLRPGCWARTWLARSPRRTARWAELAIWVQDRQLQLLRQAPSGGDPRTTASSESAAALLSVELARDGLPLDVTEAERVIAGFVGPRPTDESARAAGRRQRDAGVLRHARGASADLRNPAQVRQLLADIGITVPDTRSWRLEPFRDVHPLVEALLQWRKAERMETTYGYSWLDRQVVEGRLHGQWHASDGAGGRMTAQAGLHNLPAELRPAVAAPPGRVLVRADLGQIEPRVLAAVSRDDALADAAAEPDLYSPVAERLGVERPIAKVAVLAAMYGQTSGAAGEALRGMDTTYPRAMAYLRAAEDAGREGRAVTTYGGRRVAVWPTPAGLDEGQARAVAAARGRFTRNAVIQGAAAELFKAWAVTVRLAATTLDARIVLCLHDELLLEAPRTTGEEVVAALHRTLDSTAALWFGSTRVRFVVDVRIVDRWSDAKD